MPHISRFLLNGEPIPSVNEVTDALSKDGLFRNFYRRLGFKRADKESAKSRERGSKLAKVFEKYRQTGKTGKTSDYNKVCIDNWTKWFEESPFTITEDRFVEPHLVNTVDKYHGSPDVIIGLDGGPGIGIDSMVLGDDKSKKRFADYRLLMNEHAYAMCDSIEINGVIEKLPWEPPIKTFWFWTFCPDTGELFPVEHEFKPEIYQDFLTCKAMQEVNKRAEHYFGQYAVLLPTQIKPPKDQPEEQEAK